jgi:hypothetical protein
VVALQEVLNLILGQRGVILEESVYNKQRERERFTVFEDLSYLGV